MGNLFDTVENLSELTIKNIVKSIKELRPGIIDITMMKLSNTILVRIRFNMDNDYMSDAISCFLNSGIGGEFLVENNFNFNRLDEAFHKCIPCNWKLEEFVLMIESLLDKIKESVIEDKTYFTKDEKQIAIDEIQQLLGT